MSYRSILDASALPAQVPRSDTESARFGVEFGRLELGPDAKVTVEQLNALLEESPLDLIVIRYPAAWVDVAAGLHVAGRRAHHADTLMYYRCRLDTPAARGASLPDGYSAHVAGPADRAVLEGLVRETFDQYANHYRTNPICAPEAIVEGYVEWALHSAFEAPDTSALIVRDRVGAAQGFAVTSEGSSPELLLAGVRSEVRRRGVYSGMVRVRCDRIADRGGAEFYASTQAQNLGSQRAWVGLGFRLELVLSTVHVTKRHLLGHH